MRRGWIVFAAVGTAAAACGQRSADDCTIVLRDPSHATAEIARRYPDDPVKRARVIERCLAPDGDDCERLARIIEAIPAMAPDLAAAAAAAAGSVANGATLAGLRAQRSLDEPGARRAPGDVRTMCRDLPPELRRCMLPSYVLGHDAECQAMRAQMAQPATDREATPPRSQPSRCDASEVALYITAAGVWLATGADARCFAPRQRGAIELAWLEAELRPLAAIDCPPVVEIAAAPGVRYRDLVAVMDAAVKVGLVDTQLSAPQELAVSFAAADAGRAARHCPASTVKRAAARRATGDAAPATGDAAPATGDAAPATGDVAPATGDAAPATRHAVPATRDAGPATRDAAPATGDARPGARAASPPDKAALADAPVVMVTPRDVSLGGKPGLQPIGPVAELARGAGPIDPLRRALPPHPKDPTIILQADESTDMAVITRVIETTHAAGYSNLLLAVKNQQR